MTTARKLTEMTERVHGSLVVEHGDGLGRAFAGECRRGVGHCEGTVAGFASIAPAGRDVISSRFNRRKRNERSHFAVCRSGLVSLSLLSLFAPVKCTRLTVCAQSLSVQFGLISWLGAGVGKRRPYRGISTPAEVVFAERHTAHALAGGGEHGVGHGRGQGRERGLAQAGGREGRGNELHLDLRCGG